MPDDQLGEFYDDTGLPADPIETCETDDENLIRRIRSHVVERGGRMIPGAHEERSTIFKFVNKDLPVRREVSLASCGHEACFTIPPEGGGKMVFACVVCDGGQRWPRIEEAA